MMHPDKCVTEIVRRTAKATGCSEKSVFQFRKEEASGEGFKEPSKTKIRKNININSRFIKYDEGVRQAIRNLIYDLKYQNIVPTLSTLLNHINSAEKLPNFSIMTLRRLLRDMGFYYEKEKSGSKAILVERSEIKHELENLSYNHKKVESKPSNVPQPIAPHPNICNQQNKQPEVKPYPPSQNRIDSSEIYMTNHALRPYAIALPHQENAGLDHRFMASNMMPHQIHGLPPPPHLKPSEIGYAQMTHQHPMILQQ